MTAQCYVHMISSRITKIRISDYSTVELFCIRIPWISFLSRGIQYLGIFRRFFKTSRNLWEFHSITRISRFEDIKMAFISKFQHRRPLVWFDRNILLNFGIDVFATPFSESGISIYHNNNVRLLVLRSELPERSQGWGDSWVSWVSWHSYSKHKLGNRKKLF